MFGAGRKAKEFQAEEARELSFMVVENAATSRFKKAVCAITAGAMLLCAAPSFAEGKDSQSAEGQKIELQKQESADQKMRLERQGGAGYDLKGVKKEIDAGKIKEIFIGHISSQAYLDKLEKEFSGDLGKAEKEQRDRLGRVKDIKIDAMDLEKITEEFKAQKIKNDGFSKEFLDKLLEGCVVSGFYNQAENSVVVPNGGSTESRGEITAHEIGHAWGDLDDRYTLGASDNLMTDFKCILDNEQINKIIKYRKIIDYKTRRIFFFRFSLFKKQINNTDAV